MFPTFVWLSLCPDTMFLNGCIGGGKRIKGRSLNGVLFVRCFSAPEVLRPETIRSVPLSGSPELALPVQIVCNAVSVLCLIVPTGGFVLEVNSVFVPARHISADPRAAALPFLPVEAVRVLDPVLLLNDRQLLFEEADAVVITVRFVPVV